MKKIYKKMQKILLLMLIIFYSATICDESNFLKKHMSLNNQLSTKSSFCCRRKWSAPVVRYSNHSSSVRLLISGDIESNPGPTNCDVCDKSIRRNARYVSCEQCKTNAHLRCVEKNSRTWLCKSCTLTCIPFRGVRDLDESHLIEPNITIE